MKITKGSLRSFMSDKFEKAEKEVWKEISASHDLLKDHLLKELEVFNPVVKTSSKLGDDLEKLLDEKRLDEWYYRSYVRDARDIAGIINAIKSDEMADIKTAIKIDKPYTRFGMADLVKKAKKDVKPLYDKINDVKKLSREVESVILNATSGKKAHRDLISLGIDMSDYKEENANLPSIQKLSVDPCLVNGDCK